MFAAPWLAGLTLLWCTALPSAAPQEVPQVSEVIPSIDDPPESQRQIKTERVPRHLTLHEAIALSLQKEVLGLCPLCSLDIDHLDFLPDSPDIFIPSTNGIKILSLPLGIFGTPFQAPLANSYTLVARFRFNETRAELERNLSRELVHVETAYWNLYGAYHNLHSSEEAMGQAYEAWRISKAKYEAGEVAITQFAQTRGQYEQFRADRIAALEQVLQAERVLRQLLGLPDEDGQRLAPADSPTLSEYVPDWHLAVNEALTLRTEFIQARAELRNSHLAVIWCKSLLLPKLGSSNCNIHWPYGLPDGDGNAYLWLAQGILRLKKTVLQEQFDQKFQEVRDTENRAISFLAIQYHTIIEKYQTIQARHAQRVAFAEQIQECYQEFVAGKKTVDHLLEAQRQWAAALSSEYQQVVHYNNALARFHFAKGTILQYRNVLIFEGGIRPIRP